MKDFFGIIETPQVVGRGRHAKTQPKSQRPFAEYLGRPGADDNFGLELSVGPVQYGSGLSELEINETRVQRMCTIGDRRTGREMRRRAAARRIGNGCEASSGGQVH